MALYDDPRSAWTTRTPTGRVRIAPSTRDGIAWHWAGPRVGLFGKAHASCLSQVRSWETYHMSKGWNSIGYNALICVHARVIEGRGFDYRGAHAGPTANDAKYGVQFMLGQGESPTAAMYDRAYRLERALWEHSGHRLDSFGHRDFMSTDCPGDGIYKWAHSTHTLSGGAPAPAPAPTTEEFTVADINDAKVVWRSDIIPAPDPSDTNPNWQPDSYLRETFRLVRRVGDSLSSQVATLAGQVAGLNEALKQQQGGGTVDLAAVQAASKAGTQEALKGYSLSLEGPEA